MRRTTKTLTIASAVLAGGLLLLGDWGTAETRAQQPPAAQAAPVPLTGTWNIDTAHSNVSFAVRHLGLSTCRGRFNDFAGAVVVDAEKPEKSSVQVTIQTASIDTGIARRDEHLRKADFFDVEKYPQITFRSTRVEKGRDGGYVARGTLTMHGVSHEIALPFQAAGPVADPRAGGRIGFEANVRLNRQDYGMKFHQVLDNGALAVANDVDVALSVEAVPAKRTGAR